VSDYPFWNGFRPGEVNIKFFMLTKNDSEFSLEMREFQVDRRDVQ